MIPSSLHRCPFSKPLRPWHLGGFILFLWALFVLCGESYSIQKPEVCKGPAQLEGAVAKQPSVGTYNALGAYFAQHKQTSCAIAAFEKALKLDPKSWETHYNLSLALMQKGNQKRAAQELRQVVSQKPDLLNARNALATVLNDLGDLDGAEAEYKAALSLDSKSTYALHNLGELLLAQKRFAAAITYLKQAAEIEPNAVDHPLSLGIAYSQNGDFEEATRMLTKLLPAHPQAALVYFNLGTVYANQRRFQEAADAYRQALKLDPKNDLTRVSLVKALVSLNQFEEALPEILDYARRHPGDFDTRYLRGVALRGVGKYREAAVDLRQAASLNSDHFEAAYNFGFVLARLGKFEEARVQLERAKALNPGSADVRYQLASVLRSLKETESAKAEFEEFERRKSQGLQENIAGSTGSKANELLEQGDAQGAAQLYREALKLDPNNANRLWRSEGCLEDSHSHGSYRKVQLLGVDAVSIVDQKSVVLFVVNRGRGSRLSCTLFQESRLRESVPCFLGGRRRLDSEPVPWW